MTGDRGFVTAAVLVVLAAGGCGRPVADAGLTDDRRQQIVQEVRYAMDGFADADRARDPEAAIGYLDRSFYMYADGTRVSYAEIVPQIRAFLPALQRFDTEWTDIEITSLSPDTALATMVFHDELTQADGTVTRAWGPTTFVWRQRGDGWKLIYADADHYQE